MNENNVVNLRPHLAARGHGQPITEGATVPREEADHETHSHRPDRACGFRPRRSSADAKSADANVRAMCQKLLANPITEDFEIASVNAQ